MLQPPLLSFAVAVVEMVLSYALQMPELLLVLQQQELQGLYQQQRLLELRTQLDEVLSQQGSYLLELVRFQEHLALQTFVGSETAWLEAEMP